MPRRAHADTAYPPIAERQGRLLAQQRQKMARSAHAYVRGATKNFYQWLEQSNGHLIPDGPPIWICGDCHVGNLGPVADAKGKVSIQIRDLDQTVIGNPAHDLIRLGLSLATAARGSDLPGVTTAHIVEHMMDGYENALGPAEDKEWIPVPDPLVGVLKRAFRRRWRHLAEERIEDVKPEIPLGKRFWPLSDEERAAIARPGRFGIVAAAGHAAPFAQGRCAGRGARRGLLGQGLQLAGPAALRRAAAHRAARQGRRRSA